MDVSRLLKSWSISQPVIDRFKDNQIQMKHLKTLTEFTLEKLIPIAGERMDFLEHLEKYKEQSQETIEQSSSFTMTNFEEFTEPIEKADALITHASCITNKGVDISGDLRFALIKIILLYENEPLFVCSPIINIGFNPHVRGYEVEFNEEDNKWFCIKANDLIDYQPLYVYKMANGEQYIVLKYFL